jgi:hypothetical protein
VHSLLVLLLLLALAYLLFTGPRDLSLYPLAADSPYRLPWPAGESHLCVQGNRGVVSHRGFEEFAYDFTMPVGSDVLAARGGVVRRVDVSHDGHGWDMPNNLIVIDHGDGTFGNYLHLRRAAVTWPSATGWYRGNASPPAATSAAACCRTCIST